MKQKWMILLHSIVTSIIFFAIILFFLSFSKLSKQTRILLCVLFSFSFFIYIYKNRTRKFQKEMLLANEHYVWEDFKQQLLFSPIILQLQLVAKICKKLHLECKIQDFFAYLPQKNVAITFLPDQLEPMFYQKLYKICLQHRYQFTWVCISLQDKTPETPYYLQNKIHYISYKCFCNLMQIAKLKPRTTTQPKPKFYQTMFLPEKAKSYLLLSSLFLTIACVSSFSWIYIFCCFITLGLFTTIKIMQTKKKKEITSPLS